MLRVELNGSSAGANASGLSITSTTSGDSKVRGLVINRFAQYGILLSGQGNVVEGNFIGTNAAGDTALGNGTAGVLINASGSITGNNTIGGTTPAARNLISGNGLSGGIWINTGDANKVQGNIIGTKANGIEPLGNLGNGVWLRHGVGNVVGGMTAAARNVISGNGQNSILFDVGTLGAQVGGNLVQGNYIGTDKTGTADLGNGNNGVLIASEASLNNVGDMSADAANTIAFKSNRDGNGEVYVMDADGSNPTRLTKNSTDDTSPAFSPDGDKIVFVRLQDGTYETYAMDAVDGDGDGNGDNQVQLTSNSTSDVDPAYSPNGQKIVFASFRDGNHEIYAMNANGTGQTNLTNNTAHDVHPAYAPDGTKIAFASLRDGDYEVYEMNADGSGMPVSLTSDPAEDGAPDWQPVCTISGTTGDDFITANQSPGNDVICGLGGSDQIDAGGGHDIVIGGNENDFIVGGSGRDRVFGGLGNDTLNVRDGVRRNDLVHGGDGTDACKSDRKDRRVSCP